MWTVEGQIEKEPGRARERGRTGHREWRMQEALLVTGAVMDVQPDNL